MKAKEFFFQPCSIAQKQYEALRKYYVEGKSSKEVAAMFGYKHRGFTTIVTEFNKKIKNGETDGLFFTTTKKGRKVSNKTIDAKSIVLNYGKAIIP